MQWKLKQDPKQDPKQGDKRIIECFAFLPTRCSKDILVWLEFYQSHQMFVGRSWGWCEEARIANEKGVL